jgi:hypothetical protein
VGCAARTRARARARAAAAAAVAAAAAQVPLVGLAVAVVAAAAAAKPLFFAKALQTTRALLTSRGPLARPGRPGPHCVLATIRSWSSCGNTTATAMATPTIPCTCEVLSLIGSARTLVWHCAS